MQLTFEHRAKRFRCDTRNAHSIAIGLDFEGPQPNHFGTDPAHSQPLKLGQFVGDTASGGSCNVDVLRLIPHCNGTHTETIGHIVNEEFWVGHAATEGLSLARLVTVTPQPVERLPAADRQEGYRPELQPEDQVVTAGMLRQSVRSDPQWTDAGPQALVIRTRPNSADKKIRAYTETDQPPFMTVEAMEQVVQWDVQHLLVDFPSVDRMFDDGLLTNHHLFWKVPETTHEVTGQSRQDRTISEMVFVEDNLLDGWYLLNLQIPCLGSDAAPSRPVLYPVQFLP